MTAGAAAAPETRVLAQLDSGFESYLEDIRAAMRQPSVSRTGEGIAAMADWVEAYLQRLGAATRQVPGRVAPIVEGALDVDPAAPTLLFYELYDVQPAAGQPGWTVPPFDATIVPDGAGRRLVGRGAFNSKGPLVGFLAVLRAFRDAGVALPVNLRCVIEGEEEVGSPSLEPYLRANRESLSRCDGALIPYFATNSRGRTMIRLGFKGIMHLVFAVEGGDWGGPKRQDIHAWHCGWVASPTRELVRALASLESADGRLTLDGLDLPPPDPDDLALIDVLAERFDAETWKQELGIARFRRNAHPRDLLADLMLTPTLNIDALAAGQLDAGTDGGADPATLIPRRAVAYADLRLVPGMTVAGTLALLRAHLDRRGFGHVSVTLKTGYPASKTSPRTPVVAALLDACRRHGDDVSVFPIHAGAAPMHVFSDILGVPFAFGGLGHGLGAHAANEYLAVESLRPFFRSMASFLFAFAARARPAGGT